MRTHPIPHLRVLSVCGLLVLSLLSSGCYENTARIRLFTDGSGSYEIESRQPVISGMDNTNDVVLMLNWLPDDVPGVRVLERSRALSNDVSILHTRLAFDSVHALVAAFHKHGHLAPVYLSAAPDAEVRVPALALVPVLGEIYSFDHAHPTYMEDPIATQGVDHAANAINESLRTTFLKNLSVHTILEIPQSDAISESSSRIATQHIWRVAQSELSATPATTWTSLWYRVAARWPGADAQASRVPAPLQPQIVRLRPPPDDIFQPGDVRLFTNRCLRTSVTETEDGGGVRRTMSWTHEIVASDEIQLLFAAVESTHFALAGERFDAKQVSAGLSHRPTGSPITFTASVELPSMPLGGTVAGQARIRVHYVPADARPQSLSLTDKGTYALNWEAAGWQVKHTEWPAEPDGDTTVMMHRDAFALLHYPDRVADTRRNDRQPQRVSKNISPRGGVGGSGIKWNLPYAPGELRIHPSVKTLEIVIELRPEQSP